MKYLPNLKGAVYAIRQMKIWEKIAFFFLCAVFAGSFFTIAWKINNRYLVDVPADRGTLAEGIIGTPRFINPVLAISDADRDMVSLVYSGLLRPNNQGELISDLAEKFEISDDGLSYTFTLKPDLAWPDENPITSDDVLYTISLIKDQAMKSPRKAGWEGVDAEKIDDRKIKFTLKKPYSPFLENTTIGILPKHVWGVMTPDQIASSELNIRPWGSGPYQIRKINRNSMGIIVSYELSPNKKFSLGKPHIKNIVLKFYPSESEIVAAYQKGDIESINALTPQSLEKIKKNNNSVKTLYLPRIFAVFLNQNNSKAFTKKEVRQALSLSADRMAIIDQVLKGFGADIYSPLPPGTFGNLPANSDNASSLDDAKKILEQNGWKMNEKDGVMEKKSGKELLSLRFSLSTSDTPELRETAQLLKMMWEKIGAKVDIKIFEIGDLTQNVIRPRKYDSLLFGEMVGRDPDPFVFWHSSQRNDPGSNIALYANIKVDKLLEEARTTLDENNRKLKYEEFQKEISNDEPAIFLFSPKFIYIVPKNLNGIERMKSISVPSERFSMIHLWHKDTDKIWKIFAS